MIKTRIETRLKTRLHGGKRCIKATILLVTLLTLNTLPTLAQNRYSMTALLRCTRDDAIMQAFGHMQEGPGQASLHRIVHKPMRVIFKDMKTLHKQLKNYDALSWISHQGEQVIFVNDKHRESPPEALAALIAHEALHEDEFNSLQEEVQSWAHEAQVWMALKAKNPELAKIPKGTNPLVDRENRIEEEYRKGTLEQFVRSSPAYKNLPEISPGYEAQTAKKP